MRKHLKTFRTLLILLLVASGTISCQHKLPPAPKGELYFHDGINGIGYCSELGAGKVCPKKTDEETNNWHKYYLLSTQTMMNLNNYIDALIRLIKTQDNVSYETAAYQGNEVMASRGVYVRPQDVQELKDQLNVLLNSLKVQMQKGL